LVLIIYSGTVKIGYNCQAQNHHDSQESPTEMKVN